MRSVEAAEKEAAHLALKWGETWAVCWEPTADGEGRYFAAGAGIFPSKELSRVTDPLPAGFLESLWQKSEAIRRSR